MLDSIARFRYNPGGWRSRSALESTNLNPKFAAIAKLLRDARRRTRQTQKAVASRLGYQHVQIISQWENGDRRPPLEKLDGVAEAYDIDVDQLKSALTARGERVDESPSRALLNLLTDDELKDRVKGWVDKWDQWRRANPDALCDFFFFDPENLPAFQKQSILDMWGDNLAKDVNYHLFWVLDTSEGAGEMTNKLAKLGDEAARVARAKAKMRIHGLVLSQSVVDKKVLILFDATRKTLAKDPASTLVLERHDLDGKKQGHWGGILQYGSRIPCMVARIKGGSALGRPGNFTAWRHEDVCRWRGEDSQTGWLSNWGRSTNEIVETIDSIVPSRETQGAP